jgi:hypothetical protein
MDLLEGVAHERGADDLLAADHPAKGILGLSTKRHDKLVIYRPYLPASFARIFGSDQAIDSPGRRWRQLSTSVRPTDIPD